MTPADVARRAFVVMAGPFAGTYVATLASAWPRAPRPVFGVSRCARCGRPIAPWRQLPLVSWLVQGGRRACCGGTIPLVYPLGEAAGLIAGVLAALQTNPGAGAILFAVCLTLAYVGLVDLRRFSIPFAGLTVLAFEVAADMVRVGAPRAAVERLATGAAMVLVFALLRQLIRRDGRAGLGGGLGGAFRVNAQSAARRGARSFQMTRVRCGA
jgi:leader peptidase (prepilin peptidase)/N-methyltransferase